MALNKEEEMERNIYQLVAIGCFFAFLFMGWKYHKLKEFSQEQTADKIRLCKENIQLKCYYLNASYEADKLYDRIIELENK